MYYDRTIEATVRSVSATFPVLLLTGPRQVGKSTLVDHAAWDLACDVAVEYAVSGLGLKAAASWREERQKAAIDTLKNAVGQLTAEKLYRFFLDGKKTSAELA